MLSFSIKRAWWEFVLQLILITQSDNTDNPVFTPQGIGRIQLGHIQLSRIQLDRIQLLYYFIFYFKI